MDNKRKSAENDETKIIKVYQLFPKEFPQSEEHLMILFVILKFFKCF